MTDQLRDALSRVRERFALVRGDTVPITSESAEQLLALKWPEETIYERGEDGVWREVGEK